MDPNHMHPIELDPFATKSVVSDVPFLTIENQRTPATWESQATRYDLQVTAPLENDCLKDAFFNLSLEDIMAVIDGEGPVIDSMMNTTSSIKGDEQYNEVPGDSCFRKFEDENSENILNQVCEDPFSVYHSPASSSEDTIDGSRNSPSFLDDSLISSPYSPGEFSYPAVNPGLWDARYSNPNSLDSVMYESGRQTNAKAYSNTYCKKATARTCLTQQQDISFESQTLTTSLHLNQETYDQWAHEPIPLSEDSPRDHFIAHTLPEATSTGVGDITGRRAGQHRRPRARFLEGEEKAQHQRELANIRAKDYLSKKRRKAKTIKERELEESKKNKVLTEQRVSLEAMKKTCQTIYNQFVMQNSMNPVHDRYNMTQ